MAVGLAALPRLETFIIKFSFSTPRPHQMLPTPPVTRTVLPALTCFEFKGASEYLEDFVARIDSPRLDHIQIDYLNQLVDFQVPQLSHFIDRSVGPKLTPLSRAQIIFSSYGVSFDLWRRVNYPRRKLFHDTSLTVIGCEGIDWQVSHMAEFLSHFSTTLPNVVHLELEAMPEGRQLQVTDDVEWPHLLHQFSTVQTLHVSRELAGQVALALEEMTGEMAAEVLPSLDLIYLAGQPASSIEKFVAVRQLSVHPVTPFDTEMGFDESLKSYISE